MFSDLYKADNQMISPSDELLAQISEKMKAEVQNPTKFFWLKTQSVQRLATMASAAIILTAAAVFLPFALDGNRLMPGNTGAGNSAQVENITFSYKDGGNTDSAEIPPANNTNRATAGVTGGGNTADEKSDSIITIGEGGTADFDNDSNAFDIALDDVSYDDADGENVGEIFIEEAEIYKVAEEEVAVETVDDNPIAVDDDEAYDEIYEEEIAIPEEEVVEEDDYEETADYVNMPYCDYNSYTEWAAASIWNELSVNDVTPPKTVVPDNFDVTDSMEIPNAKTDLITLGEFAKEYLSVKHRILTLSCTGGAGTYPADYAVDNMAEFYAPVYSMLNNYLDSGMTYRHLNEVMPFFPYVYNNNSDDVIMFEMRTGSSVIYLYITSGDKLILQKNNSFAGEYELALEDGVYNKLWNYINSSPYYVLGLTDEE